MCTNTYSSDNDDIVDAIVEYGGHNIGPEDIVCVAESVVAITQGNFTRPEELDVCWQARLINRFIHPVWLHGVQFTVCKRLWM